MVNSLWEFSISLVDFSMHIDCDADGVILHLRWQGYLWCNLSTWNDLMLWWVISSEQENAFVTVCVWMWYKHGANIPLLNSEIDMRPASGQVKLLVDGVESPTKNISYVSAGKWCSVCCFIFTYVLGGKKHTKNLLKRFHQFVFNNYFYLWL